VRGFGFIIMGVGWINPLRIKQTQEYGYRIGIFLLQRCILKAGTAAVKALS
jgi:hypothetical protein